MSGGESGTVAQFATRKNTKKSSAPRYHGIFTGEDEDEKARLWLKATLTLHRLQPLLQISFSENERRVA